MCLLASLRDTMKAQQCCQSKWYPKESLNGRRSLFAQTTQTTNELRNLSRSEKSVWFYWLNYFKYRDNFCYRLWNIKPSAAHYQLYLDLIKTVSDTNYKNMNNFQRFANVSDFNEIDYLMIAREMKKNVPLASNYFTRVITEVSCREQHVNILHKFKLSHARCRWEFVKVQQSFTNCWIPSSKSEFYF